MFSTFISISYDPHVGSSHKLITLSHLKRAVLSARQLSSRSSVGKGKSSTLPALSPSSCLVCCFKLVHKCWKTPPKIHFVFPESTSATERLREKKSFWKAHKHQGDLKHKTQPIQAKIFPSVFWWGIQKMNGWIKWAKELLLLYIYVSQVWPQWCWLMWGCFSDTAIPTSCQGCCILSDSPIMCSHVLLSQWHYKSYI